MGTERVEDDVQKEFPWAHVVRWDRDSVGKRGGQEKIYKEITEGPVDVIVGTQVLAQGLHFPKVTLAAVVDADGPLHIPDFRSAERAYQLITQVAGRSGRTEALGAALIQTREPDNYAISHAVNRDFAGFAEVELSHRQDLYYPPYSYLVSVTTSPKRSKTPEQDLEKIREWVLSHDSFQDIGILGPISSKGSKGGKSIALTLKIPEALFSDFSSRFRQYLASRKGTLLIKVDRH